MRPYLGLWLRLSQEAFVALMESFSSDPQFLYDRLPFLGIGFDQRTEHLRRLSLTRKTLIPEIND
jgi:hypothetical protein